MDLEQLRASLQRQDDALPPVEQWHPEFCGDIDLVIKHNGQWFYMGTPIGRPALVKLFASVLKREGDDYFLVTPVEKVGIRVEDVPFIVTQWQKQDDNLVLETSIGDRMLVSAEHPIVLQRDRVNGDELPYVLVRRNLFARLHQNVFYQLTDIAEVVSGATGDEVIIRSGRQEFSLGSC